MSFKSKYDYSGCEGDWHGPPLRPQQVSLPAAAAAEVPEVLGNLPHDKWQKVRAAWPGNLGQRTPASCCQSLGVRLIGAKWQPQPPLPDP